MVTIADRLENFGFSATSYQNNKNGSRISAYCQRPLKSRMIAGSLPVLYVGWKTFPSAPIIREVKWYEVLKKNQKIKISRNFYYLSPLILNNNFLKTFTFNLFKKKHSMQFDHSNLLEFQNILVTMDNSNIRPTTTGDVYSFDFDSFYKILEIKEDYGYMLVCKDIDFNFVNPDIFDDERMIFLSTSLLTFVDLVELIDSDDGLQIDEKKTEIFLSESFKLVKKNIKTSESYENKKIHVIKNINSKKKVDSKKILITKDSELIKEFKKGSRSKSLIISLMGVLIKKNIEVKGEGVKYIISWNHGKIKKNLDKSQAINYIEKRLIKTFDINQKNR